MDWIAVGGVATVVLAGATAFLAWATYRLAREAREGATRQIGVQTWLALEARFDSRELRRARRMLAEQLPYDEAFHRNLSDEVPEFFESVGAVYKEGLLNRNLAVSSFSYYVNRWWKALEPYVEMERTLKGDDKKTLFADFENFAKAMRTHDGDFDEFAFDEFLSDEKDLRVD